MGKQQSDPYRVRVNTAPSRGGTGRRTMRNMRRWRTRHEPREVIEARQDPEFMSGVYGAMREMGVEPW